MTSSFPEYLAGAGDKLINDIVEAADQIPDISTRFEAALAESGRLEAIHAVVQKY